MPELPEVEVVRRGLQGAIEGAVVRSTNTRRPNLRYPFPENLQTLHGHRLTSVGRRAKHLLLSTDNHQTLVIHLGMSGRIVIVRDDQDYQLQKHDHFIMTFENGTRIIFNDTRRFGYVLLLNSDDVPHHKSLASIGPEPLSNDFNAPVLQSRLGHKSGPIKTALLDQHVVAGLGNIYVCEALHLSSIHPTRAANDLSDEEAETLCGAIKDVLTKAIEAGGSTLRDHRLTDGSLGYFQYNFSVYDRENLACPGCSCDIGKTKGIQKIKQGGRSTYFCPQKQK